MFFALRHIPQGIRDNSYLFGYRRKTAAIWALHSTPLRPETDSVPPALFPLRGSTVNI